jgi:glycine/serine hydroxymethyltransferase
MDTKESPDILSLLNRLQWLGTAVKSIVNLSAAELENLDVCRRAVQLDVPNVYVHGSILVDESEKYDTPLSEPYRQIQRTGLVLARRMTHLNFCDFRTSSALHALQLVILSLTKPQDVILYTSKAHGGHTSYPEMIRSLGRRPVPLTYDLARWMPTNSQDSSAAMILVGYSETLLCDFEISTLAQFRHIPIVLDGAQVSGFIFSQHWPTTIQENIIVTGSTHKTLPLYPIGFILSNNRDYFRQIDALIFPTFVRTTNVLYQVSNFLGLAVFERLSASFISNIHAYRDVLTSHLLDEGVNIVRHPNGSNTSHQIWVKGDEASYMAASRMIAKCNIQVDHKVFPFGVGPGLRLGVQQIAADHVPDDDLRTIATVVSQCLQGRKCDIFLERHIDAIKSLWAMERRLLVESGDDVRW